MMSFLVVVINIVVTFFININNSWACFLFICSVNECSICVWEGKEREKENRTVLPPNEEKKEEKINGFI